MEFVHSEKYKAKQIIKILKAFSPLIFAFYLSFNQSWQSLIWYEYISVKKTNNFDFTTDPESEVIVYDI